MRQIEISPLDCLFANGRYAIETLGFYPYRPGTPEIRAVLRELSAPFWPVFGEYRSGKLCEVPYREERHFRRESIDADFDASTVGLPADLDEYRAWRPDPSSLFSFSLLDYRNGSALLVRMNHVLGDGHSCMYFFVSLCAGVRARLGRPAITLPAPEHDRLTLSPGFSLGDLPLPPPDRASRSRVDFAHVSSGELQALVQGTAERGEKVSRTVALLALALRRLVELRGPEAADRFTLSVSTDMRPLVEEYGPSSFGNLTAFRSVEFSAESVRGSQPESLAIELRRSLPRGTREFCVDSVRDVERRIRSGRLSELRPFGPAGSYLLANFIHTPLELLDFGEGPQRSIYPITELPASILLCPDGDGFTIRLTH